MRSIILILLIFPAISLAQISAVLDTNNIIIGDQITLSLKGIVNKDINWPIFKDSIGNMEIISQTNIDSNLTEKGWLFQQKFIITQWDSGFYQIPSITIGNLKTKALTVTVNTIDLTEEAQIKDIKGPLEAPLTLTEIIFYVLILISLISLIYLAFRYFNRKKPIKNKIQTTNISQPPFEIALTELEKLKSQKLWQNGKIKKYYSIISEIIRTYIEEGLNTPAMEMLTEDIIHSLKSQKINTENLRKVLTTADMAKFAKAQPLALENEQNISAAIEFIHQTKPKLNDE